MSSISAKSQINLQRQKEETGSHKSLTALFQDLERISLRSEVNSLCSEPVKLYDYNDFSELDNQNFQAVSMADIFGDICGNQNELSSGMTNSAAIFLTPKTCLNVILLSHWEKSILSCSFQKLLLSLCHPVKPSSF